MIRLLDTGAVGTGCGGLIRDEALTHVSFVETWRDFSMMIFLRCFCSLSRAVKWVFVWT